MSEKLVTTFNKIQVSSPIYNASGPLCTYDNELYDLFDSESAMVLTKSCTVESRIGNAEPRYWSDGLNSINSTGLANMGYKTYHKFCSRGNRAGGKKPYIISIAGLTLEDNLKMIQFYQYFLKEENQYYDPPDDKTLYDFAPDALEINLSCPNIIGKSQVAYDLESVELYLRKIYELRDNQMPIGFKLSPYFDKAHFEKTAEIIEQFPVDFITCINSPGYGLMVDTYSEKTRIWPNQGHGGIGGKCVLPIALANVHQFRQLLPSKIQIIGCGGVSTGEDVFQHLLVGAQMVQVGTRYGEEGPSIFGRLKGELLEIMESKGYKTIKEFQGKLKYHYS